MDDLIFQAAKILENVGVISFPTETVYALAADATNNAAINKIYALKGRKNSKPAYRLNNVWCPS